MFRTQMAQLGLIHYNPHTQDEWEVIYLGLDHFIAV